MLSRRPANIVKVTPNLASFATPYSSGDVLGGVVEVPLAVLDDGGRASLLSLVVLDAANQKVAIDLVFFSDNPANSVGADNAAYGLNDLDLPLVLGRVSITQASYVSSGSNNAESTSININMIVQAIKGSKSIWVLPVSRGAPTYGSVSDLIIRLGFEQY